MSFLAPWVLVLTGGVVAAVVALHFLARLRPRRAPLPTARFVPERAARAPSRSVRPTDLLLLAMRVLAVVLAGAAFAGPVWRPAPGAVVRVVALDVSRSARAVAEGRDSALALLREGDLLIVFDSAARLVGGEARDSLRALTGSRARGSLSAALVAASRAAAVLRERADSVELVLVSPFAREEWDAATPRIRAMWRGRARLVRTAPAADDAAAGVLTVRAPRDDALAAAAVLLGARSVRDTVRIDRGAPGAADTSWARAPGHVLVRWPAEPPSAWPRRARPDTVGAVVAGDAVVVASFVRTAHPPAGRVVARWVDGQPAAAEHPTGRGCVRDVAIALPKRGDLALRESTLRLVRALTEPCGGARDLAVLPEPALARLRGDTALLAARALPPAPHLERHDGLVTWLLAAAALLVLAEPLARRAGRTGDAT